MIIQKRRLYLLHPKEFSRLIKEDTSYVITKPVLLSVKFAKEHNVIVLLKGTSTVITDGNEVYISTTGCPGMATGGSGDVLSGIIAALCGYNKNNLLFAVASSAYINGIAGEIAESKSNSIAMTSCDTALSVKDAIVRLSRQN